MNLKLPEKISNFLSDTGFEKKRYRAYKFDIFKKCVSNEIQFVLKIEKSKRNTYEDSVKGSRLSAPYPINITAGPYLCDLEKFMVTYAKYTWKINKMGEGEIIENPTLYKRFFYNKKTPISNMDIDGFISWTKAIIDEIQDRPKEYYRYILSSLMGCQNVYEGKTNYDPNILQRGIVLKVLQGESVTKSIEDIYINIREFEQLKVYGTLTKSWLETISKEDIEKWKNLIIK